MRRLATGLRFRHREERSDAAIQSRRLGPSSLNRFACARDDKRAMRDVRIVARVLDDAGAGETGSKLMARKREFWSQALRQRDRNRIGNAPVRSASNAARAAPLAQAPAPVIQPRLRLGSFGSLMRAGLARGAQFA